MTSLGEFGNTSMQASRASQCYRYSNLPCFEAFADIDHAIAREKQIKGWCRDRKIELESLALREETIILYEAPHHFLDTMEDLMK